MKTKILLSLFIMVPGLLFAQKVVAPPSRITLPSDTSRVVPSSSKVNAQDSTLTVPEVLIYGKDKTTRNVDDKIDFNQETPTLYKPQLEHDPVSNLMASTQNKPEYERTANTMQRMTWADLTGGGYSTVIANAGYWQRIKKGDFRVNGNFDRSSGQFDNSDHTMGGISGNLHYVFNKSKTTSFAELYSKDLGMFNYMGRSDVKRTITNLNAGTEWYLSVSKLADSKVGFHFNNLSITDDSSATINTRDQFTYKLFGEYNQQFKYAMVKGFGGFERDSDNLDNASNHSHFGELGAEFSGNPINSVMLSAGLKYQSFDSNFLTSVDKAAPFAKVNYMPSKNIGVTLQYQSGLEYTPFTEWLSQNPYVVPEIASTANELKYDLQFDVQYEPKDGMHLYSTIDYKGYDQYIYWNSPDTTLNPVSLNSLNDMDLLSFSLGGKFNLSERSRLQIGFTKYQTSMNDTTGFVHKNVPYIPEYMVPVKLIFEPLKGTTISLDAEITGKRYIAANMDETLSGYTVFNIAVQQSFGNISAHIKLQNLFDSEYSYWYNYPQKGVHLLAGISARF